MTLIQKITDKVQNLPLEINPTQKDIDNYNLSINNLVKIADDFAIGFAEWLLIIYNEDIIYDAYTKEELLEIYKKEIGL